MASNPTRLVQVRSVFRSRNAGGVVHPHFVLTPTNHESGTIIVVNCTSIKIDEMTGQPLPNQDYSCRLEPGVHEWIDRDSIIYYKDAQLWTPEDLRIEAQPGTANVSANFITPDLLKSMQYGLLSSRRTPEGVHSFLLSLVQK